MRIYIGHPKKINYVEELYQPLRKDPFFLNHELILPHEESSTSSNTRDFYKTIDLFIAECSEAATGLGIELGWAYDDNIEIHCIHKSGKKITRSIKAITNNIYEYNNTGEMIKIIKDIVEGRKNER